MTSLLIILLSLMAVANMAFYIYVERSRRRAKEYIEDAAEFTALLVTKNIFASAVIESLIRASSLTEEEKNTLITKVSSCLLINRVDSGKG